MAETETTETENDEGGESSSSRTINVPSPSLPTDGYRKAVVISLLGTALLVSLDRSFRGSFPRPRVFVALLFVWIFLAFMAEFAPKLAAYFAALIFVGVAVDSGPYVFDQISKRIDAGRSKPPAKRKVQK